MKFEIKIQIRWADADPNQHVRHSAYYDYGAHARIRFFQQHGFTAKKLNDLNIGPIIFKEECSFIKELHSDDEIKVNILKGEVSEDGSRWVLHHEIFNQKNIKCAQISTQGAWIDLTKRKLSNPPLQIAKALINLPVGDYYLYRKSSNKTNTVKKEHLDG